MKKWHKIALLIILIAGILVCVKSCTDKVDSDIIIAYIGNDFVAQDKFEQNISQVENACEDVNGDGKAHISLMEVTFNNELTQEQAQQKMTNAVGLGTARVYVLTEAYLIVNSSYDVFEDLSRFGDGFKNSEGQTVGISLEGNELVKDLGFPQNEKLYLAVRKVSEVDNAMDKDIDKKHNSAMKVAEYILN